VSSDKKSTKSHRTHKYYAVTTGRHPGIYTSWPTAQKQVHGFSGAAFQGFLEYSDAMSFLYAHGNIPDADRRYLVKRIPLAK
jgi:viroplasmin and RNaseH domain-containing protein